ncbi:MAG: HTTM domain-containing protein [Bacteroidetes bacterium]|nr:HTTM domain-containing protein [Bacteroidota bacterium]
MPSRGLLRARSRLGARGLPRLPLLVRLRNALNARQSLAPLAGFRVLFGLLMLASLLRFAAKGWIQELYLDPTFFFKYPGFEWVQVPGAAGMYALFAVMGLGALGVALGCFYRVSALAFFSAFTYVELLDKTNYLNHYYFVSLVACLLIFLPAHRRFSVDALRKPRIRRTHAPRWVTGILPLQIGLVYFFAGLAKINADWLLHALPLRIWLPAQTHLPLIGPLLGLPVTAWVFSWVGMLYDLTLPLWLNLRATRPWAYAAAVVFHGLTAWLFPIGMFPWIMLAAALIFFPAGWHERWQRVLGDLLGRVVPVRPAVLVRGQHDSQKGLRRRLRPLVFAGLAIWFTVQLALPFRYLLYPGSLFWTESGYRFSWRVMLMEKAGYASFRVQERGSARYEVVRPSDYLTPNQEKMMATQPDMILQFARHLAQVYRERGLTDPAVYADVWVSLNGRGSRVYVYPNIDLARVDDRSPRTEWMTDPELKVSDPEHMVTEPDITK